MKTLQLLALLLFSSLSIAQVTQISASVDRNTILLDESIVLTVVANGSADRDALEFSSLQTNFSLSRPSFSQSTQIVNGSMSRTVSWKMNLYPLQSGKFSIPTFTIDGQSSSAFEVTVLPLNTQNTAQPRDYFVEAEISSEQVYLQQQLLYTIKIHLMQDIQRGNLSLPQLDGAIIEQIGEDKDYQEIKDGVRYRIIERNYAIIPQASGTFTIEGPIFEAQVLTNSRQSFANFGRTRTIARRAPNIAINVQGMPNNYNYPWLPSELVEVSEEWQGDANNLQVGEPITRTVTLTAMGLTKEQLPDIDTPYHPSFKVYPEQVQLSGVEHKNALVAQGVFNTAIIPSQSGQFVLPEVKIPWFNVTTGQTEFATLPARTVQVTNANNQVSTPNIQAATPPDVIKPVKELPNAATNVQSNTSPQWLVWLLISTNLFTLVVVVVLVLVGKKSTMHKLAAQPTPFVANKASEEQLFKALKEQLERGNASQLSEKLDAWLAKLLGNTHHSVSLSLSKGSHSNAATSALSQYNKVLASQYSNKATNVDYAALIKGLQEYRSHAKKTETNKPLSELYPK